MKSGPAAAAAAVSLAVLSRKSLRPMDASSTPGSRPTSSKSSGLTGMSSLTSSLPSTGTLYDRRIISLSASTVKKVAHSGKRLTGLQREEAERAGSDGDVCLRILVDSCLDAEATDEGRPPQLPLPVELLEERRLVHLLELAQL